MNEPSHQRRLQKSGWTPLPNRGHGSWKIRPHSNVLKNFQLKPSFKMMKMMVKTNREGLITTLNPDPNNNREGLIPTLTIYCSYYVLIFVPHFGQCCHGFKCALSINWISWSWLDPNLNRDRLITNLTLTLLKQVNVLCVYQDISHVPAVWTLIHCLIDFKALISAPRRTWERPSEVFHRPTPVEI